MNKNRYIMGTDPYFEEIRIHKVEFYKSFWKKEWRWRIRANNGKIIASSSEGYFNKQDCEYNAKSTAKSLNAFFNGE